MRIANQDDIEEGLEFLVRKDRRMKKILRPCGPIPLRLSEPGFAGLASIIVSQQVSKASAEAIFGRLKKLVDPLSPEQFLQRGEPAWIEAGLSRPKQRTLCAISEAILAGKIDLYGLCTLEPDLALEHLVAIKGIGPWTGEVYLMFCAGHRDIFPAGDLALQEAIRLAHDLDLRPSEKQCREIAEQWKPWRAVAARMLWEYYATVKRDATPSL
jgi:DNA-3-methyladenine glycosylase II